MISICLSIYLSIYIVFTQICLLSEHFIGIPDACFSLKKEPTPSTFAQVSSLSSTRVNTLGECVGLCNVTSGCVAVALERPFGRGTSLSTPSCTLGKSHTDIVSDLTHDLYHLTGDNGELKVAAVTASTSTTTQTATTTSTMTTTSTPWTGSFALK